MVCPCSANVSGAVAFPHEISRFLSVIELILCEKLLFAIVRLMLFIGRKVAMNSFL